MRKKILQNLVVAAAVFGGVLGLARSDASAANHSWSLTDECGASLSGCDNEERSEYWYSGSVREEVYVERSTNPGTDYEEIQELGDAGGNGVSSYLATLNWLEWMRGKTPLSGTALAKLISCAEYKFSCADDGICSNYTHTYYFGCPDTYAP